MRIARLRSMGTGARPAHPGRTGARIVPLRALRGAAGLTPMGAMSGVRIEFLRADVTGAPSRERGTEGEEDGAGVTAAPCG